MHIDGEIVGKIFSDSIVTIGKLGRINGEVHASRLIVNGVFEGDANCDNVEVLEKTILEIYNLSQEKRDAIGQKIRKYAEDNYSIEILVDKFEKLLEDEIRKKNA